MTRKGFISLILLLFSPISQLQCEDYYSEYWQKFFWKMWEHKSFVLGTYIKIDTGNHFKSTRSLQFNEQLSWKASKNFSLEIHYAYLHGRSVVPNSLWKWQHRLELEANPTFQLPCHYLIKTRNRLEIRRLQREPKTQYEFRQRTMFVVPFEKWGPLKSFSLYNELFYNISTRLITQDRVCPCQLTFALSDKVDLDLFFLVYFFNTDNVWKKSAVFGTQLNF